MILVTNLARKHIGIEAINSEPSGQIIIGHNFPKSISSTRKKPLETIDLNLLARSTTALSRRSLIKHKVSISDGLSFFLFMANSSFTKLNKAFDALH